MVSILASFRTVKSKRCGVIALMLLMSPFAISQSEKGYRDVASWREPGVQIEYSSFLFRSNRAEDQVPCPANHGLDTSNAIGACTWKSNEYQHLPQWVWVHFVGLRRIDKVVLHAASMETRPVQLVVQFLERRGAEFHTIVHIEHTDFDPHTLTCTIHFAPVITDNLRLVIERTAATATPQSWFAELKELQVYGTNALGSEAAASVGASASHVIPPHSSLAPTQFVPSVEDLGQALAVSTPWYRIVLDKSFPHILSLALDSLGKGELGVNLLQEGGAYPVLDGPFQKARPLGAGALKRNGSVFRYAPVEVAPGVYEQVAIRVGAQGFDLELAIMTTRAVIMRGGLFRFQLAANQTPTTFVCRPSMLINYVKMPAYLTAPDFGTVYITRSGDAAAFYRKPSFLHATSYEVDITPGQPAGEDGLNRVGPGPWRTILHFAVQKIEPLPELLSRDPRLERFPKYALNMVQWRPDTGIMHNSVMSIDCPLSLIFYAEQAVWAPRLEGGISPMALVSASVDRYFNGVRGYTMASYKNVFKPDWTASRETPAYLVISAWYVIRTIGGIRKLNEWLKPMEAIANRTESHFGNDGLVWEEGSEWFDVYNYQGPDAFSNAADYRAFLCMADVESLAGRPALAKRYRDDAARIRTVYFKTYFNPETGVLAGWKSPDGKLHDYMFPWINGFAIYAGLVPDEQAKSILQTMLAKMDSIGFHSFELGIPTNLIPISPADYIPHTSGAPRQPDGKDTWQVYMNGGATPPYEYYFIQALYQAGMAKDAERLLWPLMESYGKGTFNAGIGLPGLRQRNPVGSAFYMWNGSKGRGEGYLPENWQGVDALFTGHFGIGFDKNGYFLEPWSPLREQRVKLGMYYMGKFVPFISSVRQGRND